MARRLLHPRFLQATLWHILPTVAKGGDQWTVQRGSSGDGIGAPITVTTLPEPVELWIVEAETARVVIADAQFVPDATWYVFVRPGTDLQQHDVVLSVVLPGSRFQVMSLHPQIGGYLLGVVEPR